MIEAVAFGGIIALVLGARMAQVHGFITEELPHQSQRHLYRAHISTDQVYGSLDATGLFTEQTGCDPSSPYSASKASSVPSSLRGGRSPTWQSSAAGTPHRHCEEGEARRGNPAPQAHSNPPAPQAH
jgi:hypothetical protein